MDGRSPQQETVTVQRGRSERGDAAPAETSALVRRALQRLTGLREFNILVALLVLGAFLSVTTDAFLTTGNLFGVARAFSLTAIVAIGQTMVNFDGWNRSLGWVSFSVGWSFHGDAS